MENLQKMVKFHFKGEGLDAARLKATHVSTPITTVPYHRWIGTTLRKSLDARRVARREYTVLRARGSKQDARMRSSVVRPIAVYARVVRRGFFQEDSVPVSRSRDARLWGCLGSAISAHYQPGTLNVLVNHRSGWPRLLPRFLASRGSMTCSVTIRENENLEIHALRIWMTKLNDWRREFSLSVYSWTCYEKLRRIYFYWNLVFLN